MRIILDTNIWISVLIGKQSDFIKELLTDGSISIYICEELLIEFIEVSNRPKIRKYVSERDIRLWYNLLNSYCKNIKLDSKSHSEIRDIDDLYLLSLAEKTDADYLITGDKDLLVLGKHSNTSIVSISQFCHLTDI